MQLLCNGDANWGDVGQFSEPTLQIAKYISIIKNGYTRRGLLVGGYNKDKETYAALDANLNRIFDLQERRAL